MSGNNSTKHCSIVEVRPVQQPNIPVLWAIIVHLYCTLSCTAPCSHRSCSSFSSLRRLLLLPFRSITPTASSSSHSSCSPSR